MARRAGSRGRAVPKYRLHKSTGKAVVTINGKDIYLGKYDTQESHQKYKQLIADHWAAPGTAPKPTVPDDVDNVTVSRLAVEYAKHVKRKHGDDSKEWKQVRLVLKSIRETYGHLPAAEFGPVRFENYRQSLIDRELTRQVITRKSNYVIKMFQQAVKFELIPVELWQRLLAVGPVEMKEKPKRKRGAVPLEIVKATQAELTQVLSDMVEVHRLIGARPSEVCNMRPGDIDRSADVWVYIPASHKTEHHGHSRRISIGPKAQKALSRYLFREPQAFCFTPSEAFEQHCERRHRNRTTPMNEGNKPMERKPRTFQPNYNKDSYRRAIERAALRAFPMSKEVKESPEKAKAWKEKYVWKPNQLRKSAATTARKKMDLETAQILLGHSSKKTTEKYYAEIDNERAVEFARQFG
ncbi:MAG: tyrosine-type recombinase/integrase [Mariniblastus sp.]